MSDVSSLPQPGHNAGRKHDGLRAARERRDPSSAPTRYELAWKKGQDGELRLGHRLNLDATAVGGVGVLHDLVRPGEQANIDHLVVGPAGVTVIDAKSWTGAVSHDRGELHVGRRRRPKPLEGMRRQLDDVRRVLGAAGHGQVPVAGIVCFVDDNAGLPHDRLVEVGGVIIGRTAPTVHRAFRDGPLNTDDVKAVLAALAQQFDVHGGMATPTERLLAPPPVAVRAEAVPRAPLMPASSHQPARAHRLAPRPRGNRRGGRPPVRSRSRRTGMGADLLKLAAILVAMAFLLPALAPSRTLARADLDRAGPALRQRATLLAGHRVRGPRVVTRNPEEFVLVYRSGERCVVHLRVDRSAGPSALTSPAWSRHGCGTQVRTRRHA
jgi:Nuclease-related domain